MIKIYNIRNILRIAAIILLFALVIAILSNKISVKRTIESSANLKSIYKILVDVEESKLYLFENDILSKEYKCSGGKWTTPSPIGTWTITSKAKWGEGFGRELAGAQCPLGKIWNTRNLRPIFFRLGKFSWLYKNG